MTVVLVFQHPETKHFRVLNEGEYVSKKQELDLCGYRHIETINPAMFMQKLFNGEEAIIIDIDKNDISFTLTKNT